MPMKAFTLDEYLVLIADFGVEQIEIQLPRMDGSSVTTLTLLNKDEQGQRFMVPLGRISRDSIVSPQEVNSWCERLRIPKIGYGTVEDD